MKQLNEVFTVRNNEVPQETRQVLESGWPRQTFSSPRRVCSWNLADERTWVGSPPVYTPKAALPFTLTGGLKGTIYTIGYLELGQAKRKGY